MKNTILTLALTALTATTTLACGYGGFGVNCRNYGELSMRDFNETNENIFLGEIQRVDENGAMFLAVRKWKGVYSSDTIYITRSTWNYWNNDENLSKFKVGQEWLMYTSAETRGINMNNGNDMYECSRSSMRGTKKFKEDLAFFEAIEAKPNGLYKDFNKKGILIGIGHFKDGLPTGTWKYFDDEGHKTAVANYDNGARNGRWTTFNTEGTKTLVLDFENDVEVYRLTMNYEGNKQSEIITNDEQRIYRNFHASGTLSYESIRSHDGKSQADRFYHENGLLKQERFYENGARTGVWKSFNDAGMLTGTENHTIKS